LRLKGNEECCEEIMSKKIWLGLLIPNPHEKKKELIIVELWL
jgi:hypothetical protein